MWAQLVKMRMRADRPDGWARLRTQLAEIEQPGSGLIRVTSMRDQKDPLAFYTLVVLESEEKARERENDPRRQEGLEKVRAIIGDIVDGAPEFVDLEVLAEITP